MYKQKNDKLFLHQTLKSDTEKDINEMAKICKALSTPLRIQIVNLLKNKSLSLTQIANYFDLPISTIAFNLQFLVDANILTLEYSPTKKGHTKWFSYNIQHIELDFSTTNVIEQFSSHTQEVPIGNYVNIELGETNGIATETKHLFSDCKNKAFICERNKAQLIWSSSGFIEYNIDNSEYKDKKIKKLEISLELCSESNGFNENYPSDITFWINNIEIGTFHSLGDYGDRYGKYTPRWWYEESTKYGQLVNISLSSDGVLINGKSINNKVKIHNLNITENNYFTFKFGIKDDAINHGGFNIFGEKFGDYQQGIIFFALFDKE